MPLETVLATLPSGSKLQQGWSPQCEKEPAGPEEWGVLKTTAIQAGAFLDEHHKRLPDHLVARPALEVHSGDLLLTNAGPRARCAVPCLVRTTRARLMLSGKFYRFRADDSVMDSRFLEYFLLAPTTQDRLDHMKTGISDSGLNLTRSRFLGLPVVMPPLDAQQRIVDLLEDHLSRLDGADTSLRQARKRQTALLRSTLDNLTSRWSTSEVPLSELVERVEAGKSFGSASRPATPDEWGIVKVSAMTWGTFRPEENKVVTDTARIDERYEIRASDILVSRANTTAYVGASVFVDVTPPRLLLSDKSLRLIPRAGVSPQYLHAVLQAPRTRSQISALATGTKDSMRNISQGVLLSVRVPDASAEAQNQVIAAIASVTQAATSVRDATERAAHRGEALRRSLLSAAFEGRLTA